MDDGRRHPLRHRRPGADGVALAERDGLDRGLRRPPPAGLLTREAAIERLGRLHEAQGAFYAGGPDAPLRDLLAEDVVWHVPGDNAIAGTYAGRGAVMAYFARRRDLAQRTFRMHPGEVLTGDGEHVAVLTDGTAVIDGRELRWSTVGLYRFDGDRVAACWLLPLDPVAFDAAWRTPADGTDG